MPDDEVVIDPRLDAAQEGDPDDLIDVVVRVAQPGVVPEGVVVVAELGDVLTGRIRRQDIRRVHDDELVESLKPAVAVRLEPDASAAGPEWPDDAWPADPELDPGGKAAGDARRPTRDPATGRGTTVAIVDWWFDLAHRSLRHEDGRTRVRSLWDQRTGTRHGTPPAPYGYGRVLDRDTIDRALSTQDPYSALDYSPSGGDPTNAGTHGTHVAGIAGGSAHVAPPGVAPGCEFLLVHLGGRGGSLGNSASLLEAVDWVSRTAGTRPWVLSLSMGSHADAHLGLSLTERGLDQVVDAAAGRCVSQSTGNYYAARVHAAITLDPGDEQSVSWEVTAGDPTANELELWYPGRDVVVLTLRTPDGRELRLGPGERGAIRAGSREICRGAHRRRDPNTGYSNAVCTLERDAPAGTWTVTLIGQDIVDGRCHLWIERDQPGQSRFAARDAVRTTTTGSICNGFHTIAVGAYDAHSPNRPVGPFSSVGPTLDGRRKPVLVAPGVGVLAAKSAPAGSTRGGDAVTRKDGTSMAAPHVAGTIALMYEAAGRPLTVREIRHLLVQSVDAPAAAAPDLDRFGAGYLNVDRALELTRRWVREQPARRETEAEPAAADGTQRTDERDGRALLRDVARLQGASLAPGRAVLADGSPIARALAQTYNRIGGLISVVASELHVEPAAILAIWQVESGGRTYTAGRPVLRVENHLLFDAWGRAHPAEFDAHFQFGMRPPLTADAQPVCGQRPCDRRWRCHRSRQTQSDPFTCDHTSQAREYDVLALASRLAGEETALRCSSLGGPQILGSHHARLGYPSAVATRDAFAADERWEVLAFFDFCRADQRLIAALQQLRFDDFARVYNGAGQVAEYAARASAAYSEARTLLGAAQPTPADERWELADTQSQAADELRAAQQAPSAAVEGEPAIDELAARARQLVDPARVFRAVLTRSEAGNGAESVAADYEVLGRPGDDLQDPLQPGDLIVRGARGEPAASSVAVVASARGRAADELQQDSAELMLQAGEYVDAYLPERGGGPGRVVPLRVRTSEGVLASDCVALRPRVKGATGTRARRPAVEAADVQPGAVLEQRAADVDRFGALGSCTVDPYRYDPTGQVCADGPAPGTSALRRLLREQFGERRAGIFNCRPVRGGSRLSLHGEGRAVDYYLDAHDPSELQIGNRLVQWLLEDDAAGNPHVRARRLGVQEIIWNGQIWTTAGHQNEGLRAFSGRDPHTDHVHVGQHRLGAAMRTSFWTGC
jgi:subtilisin family serine protease